MLSPARKPGLRLEVVVLWLLACLASLGWAHAVETTADQSQKIEERNTASLAGLHADASPVDDLSAAEPEQSETDAVLGALPVWSGRVAPIMRFVIAGQRVVIACGWRPRSIGSVVMAQGPPRALAS